MFKHLIVLFALVAVASGAMTPEESSLYFQKGALESVIFTAKSGLGPEKVLIAVNELHKINEKLPLPEHPVSGERTKRDIIDFLHIIGQLPKEHCEDLAAYNQEVDVFTQRFASLVDACNFVKAYKLKQNEMC